MTLPGLEPELPRWYAGDNRLAYGTTYPLI
jgi:hypothetical protein